MAVGYGGEIDTRTRMDPGASLALGGGGPVSSAWVAGECNLILWQELAESEVRAHADLALRAKVKDL